MTNRYLYDAMLNTSIGDARVVDLILHLLQSALAETFGDMR